MSRPLDTADCPDGFVLVPKQPASCQLCGYKTKINGTLEHERNCKMKAPPRTDVPEVTDAMRHAAWTVYPRADVPYTEIYWAMQAAAK